MESAIAKVSYLLGKFSDNKIVREHLLRDLRGEQSSLTETMKKINLFNANTFALLNEVLEDETEEKSIEVI